MSKKDKKELGNKVKGAMLKFGHVNGDGTVVCIPTEDSRKLLGTNDEIRDALAEIGIDDTAVEDGTNKSGKKMTCIATTVEQLTKDN